MLKLLQNTSKEEHIVPNFQKVTIEKSQKFTNFYSI